MLLCIAVLASLWGCGAGEEDLDNPVVLPAHRVEKLKNSADLSKLEADIVFSRWHGQNDSVDGREMQIKLKNLNKYPVKNVKVRVTVSYSSSDQIYQVDHVFGKDLLGLGHLTAGVLLPYHRSKRLNLVVPFGEEGWRLDLQQKIEILSAEKAIAGADLHDPDNLLLFIGDATSEQVDAAISKDETLMKVRNDQGAGPIHFAAMQGDSNMLDVLVKHGADPKERLKSGHNLLHFAAVSTPEMVKKVRSFGVVPCLTHDSHFSPIFYAVEMGNVLVLKPLVDAGVDLESRDTLGNTALLLAIVEYQPDIALDLKNLGAKVDVYNNLDYGPMCMAMTIASEESWNILLKNKLGKVNESGPKGTTPAIVAAKMGNLSACDWLADHGGDFNKRDKSGHSALDYMSRSKYAADQANYNRFLERHSIVHQR